MTKVGFIGLTHLGIVTSIAFSKKKINVVAYDTNIKKITDGKVLINVKEPFQIMFFFLLRILHRRMT